ncbi:hypothetical protein LS68_003055 [Helicobacter sp. MIT 05-5293]|uniref:hypothetical protein n=1 Tax=Helicobacter sp. MIT 05-5293 TaxID=1548149 RepID=UPI00051DACC0|nr:hypothetical protein [Helicobacter sp. MIT 05-5293]TLD82002.1 hypothetical protein LS68_003055 [Helicobacter sp. MIT 05-5293]
MSENADKINEEQISICPSCLQSLIILVLSVAFVVGSIWLFFNKAQTNFDRILLGICVLGSTTALLISLYIMILCLLHKPILRIYKDRVESRYCFRHWVVYPFEEIEIFTIMKISGVKIINVHFLDGRFPKTLNSSLICDQIDICDLLNKRLELFDKQMLSIE